MERTTNNATPLLNEHAAAVRLGFRVPTLRNWRHLGKGPAYLRLGGRSIRYRPEDLDTWANAGSVTPDQHR